MPMLKPHEAENDLSPTGPETSQRHNTPGEFPSDILEEENIQPQVQQRSPIPQEEAYANRP